MPEKSAASGWVPDGCGLGSPISAEVAAERSATVHLRLTAPDRYPKTGCGGGLGQFWTGDPSEVTCPACLEVVHA